MHRGHRPRGLRLAQRVFSLGPAQGRAKMEWVPEVLQFPVIVEWRWVLAVEPEPLQELNFFLGCITAHRLVPKKFFQPRLFLAFGGFAFDKLKPLCVTRNESPI